VSQEGAFGSFLVNNTQTMPSHIKVGTGKDATTMKQLVWYKYKLTFDRSKSDGMSRKLTDVTRLAGMGYKCSIVLQDGLKKTYDWYGNRRLI
jgi:GDP-L-fucose synthase